MNDPDFRRIERELNVALPQDYQTLLANYPQEIQDASEMHLSDDANWVISTNQMLREDPASFFGCTHWVAQHLVIGEDGNGNCFYLDLTRPPSAVYLLDHETPDEPGTEVAPNLEDWIPLLRVQLDELERNRIALEENMRRRRQPRKPWWKWW